MCLCVWKMREHPQWKYDSKSDNIRDACPLNVSALGWRGDQKRDTSSSLCTQTELQSHTHKRAPDVCALSERSRRDGEEDRDRRWGDVGSLCQHGSLRAGACREEIRKQHCLFELAFAAKTGEAETSGRTSVGLGYLTCDMCACVYNV